MNKFRIKIIEFMFSKKENKMEEVILNPLQLAILYTYAKKNHIIPKPK